MRLLVFLQRVIILKKSGFSEFFLGSELFHVEFMSFFQAVEVAFAFWRVILQFGVEGGDQDDGLAVELVLFV